MTAKSRSAHYCPSSPCPNCSLRPPLHQISMVVPSGERIERLPVWIRRVTQDLDVSPVYDARFWNPPPAEQYRFKNARPRKPDNIRIYEAHVGISTSEPRVGQYKEFTRDVLPRIRDLGYNTIQLMAVMEHAYYACEWSATFASTPKSHARSQPLVIKLHPSLPLVPVMVHPKTSRS
jgi:hypothetical protein